MVSGRLTTPCTVSGGWSSPCPRPGRALGGADRESPRSGHGGVQVAGLVPEIITWLDDHSRLALHLPAHPRISAAMVVATFTATADPHGHPASTLTDGTVPWRQ